MIIVVVIIIIGIEAIVETLGLFLQNLFPLELDSGKIDRSRAQQSGRSRRCGGDPIDGRFDHQAMFVQIVPERIGVAQQFRGHIPVREPDESEPLFLRRVRMLGDAAGKHLTELRKVFGQGRLRRVQRQIPHEHVHVLSVNHSFIHQLSSVFYGQTRLLTLFMA